MNIGLKLAYFLWVMKGSNNLIHLSYYGDDFNKKSDDEETLRGAYGPRLRNWVGPDQYQEMINKNQDIDDPQKLKKPNGVDQLEKVYNDLKAGIPTCCQIFDPSIDFEDTNNIPDLLTIGFGIKGNSLVVKGFFSNKDSIKQDEFLLKLLGSCMAAILDLEELSVQATMIVDDDSMLWSRKQYQITNKTPEDLWHDIHLLCDLEKHLRNSVTKDSVNLKTVDVLTITDNLIKKYIGAIKCDFWKDYGYTLIKFVLEKYGKDKYEDYIGLSIKVNIKTNLET